MHNTRRLLAGAAAALAFALPAAAADKVKIGFVSTLSGPNAAIGIDIALDGQSIGAAQIFSNGAHTHRAVVPAYLPAQLAQGAHTLSLTALTGATQSDANDFYTAVLEY